MSSMNKAKMSAHSRAAMSAADTVRNVISGMNDTAFMQEDASDATASRRDRAERARELVGDAPQYILDRIGREMEQEHGI